MSVANRFRQRLLAAAWCATGIAAPAVAQLVGPGGVLPDAAGDVVGEPLGGRIGGAAGAARDTVGGVVRPAAGELDTGIASAEAAADALVDEIDRIAAAATEIFLGADDPTGQTIERDIWVVLVPAEFADSIDDWDFTIRERRALEGLDLVMLRIEAPQDRGMAETELDLQADAPGTVVDFNHVYVPGQGDAAAPLAGRPAAEPPPLEPAMPADALTLGLVDTAIATAHEAFAGVVVVQRDFVPYAGDRPRRHGTAVASIAIEALASPAREAPLGLYAASVFLASDDDDLAATTGSLVAALEWLGSQSVEVINMSLTGPPNRVLEAALAAVARRGTVVVAAVGNDGPAARPLYPAAYETVLGITAVDADARVYRRANRGPQVDFAALGVRVSVATDDGGHARESGTSMAAPVAAAIIAASSHRSGEQALQMLPRLKRAAVDLGDAGFDEVFGHGLITPLE